MLAVHVFVGMECEHRGLGIDALRQWRQKKDAVYRGVGIQVTDHLEEVSGSRGTARDQEAASGELALDLAAVGLRGFVGAAQQAEARRATDPGRKSGRALLDIRPDSVGNRPPFQSASCHQAARSLPRSVSGVT